MPGSAFGSRTARFDGLDSIYNINRASPAPTKYNPRRIGSPGALSAPHAFSPSLRTKANTKGATPRRADENEHALPHLGAADGALFSSRHASPLTRLQPELANAAHLSHEGSPAAERATPTCDEVPRRGDDTLDESALESEVGPPHSVLGCATQLAPANVAHTSDEGLDLVAERAQRALGGSPAAAQPSPVASVGGVSGGNLTDESARESEADSPPSAFGHATFPLVRPYGTPTSFSISRASIGGAAAAASDSLSWTGLLCTVSLLDIFGF